MKHSKKLLLIKNQELTESENNLRKARDKAEKASNMKTSFIRNMTHEIRTPLNSIVGFSQVISSQFKKDDETHEFANLIEKNSDKLLKLIDDVLELSDLESSEDMELESTNIHICCEQALSKIQPYISKDVSLEFHPWGTANSLSIRIKKPYPKYSSIYYITPPNSQRKERSHLRTLYRKQKIRFPSALRIQA